MRVYIDETEISHERVYYCWNAGLSPANFPCPALNLQLTVDDLM